MECAGCARRKQRDLALPVSRGELFRRRPVVGDFVVIPLHEDRYLGIEGAQIVVEKIVLVRGAEFVERFRDLGLFRNGDVLPDLAVGQLYLVGKDAVGVDGTSGMQQEIRFVLAHGGEGDHAAVIRIDAPALSRDIATPDEADVAPIARRGTEAAVDRLA